MPDLVITDVDMPDGDGLEVVRILREQLPELQVIVVSANTGKGYERMAREEGAAGFIPKSQLSVEALSQLVRREGSR